MEMPSSFEKTGEPDVDIVGPATLSARPDLGQLIVVLIVLFMMHGATPKYRRSKRILF
jgi:hypothetical protein